MHGNPRCSILEFTKPSGTILGLFDKCVDYFEQYLIKSIKRKLKMAVFLIREAFKVNESM